MDKPNQIHALFSAMTAVDLAPKLEPGIPKWPTHPHLIIDPTVNHAHDGYACQCLMLPEHCGCHVDAPFHNHPGLTTVENLDLTCLMAPAVLYDFGPLNMAPGDMLTPEMFENYEREKGVKVGPGEIALINFGWMSRYWRNDDKAQWYATNAPGMTEESAIFFKERGIKAIGADTVAVEIPLVEGKAGAAAGHLIHWLPNDILIIEMLTNLEKLALRSYFAAAPLPIIGGSGSPLRPIGFTER
ncbi:MAG: cyclase family protein [Rhizobiaceae bacterium]|nr:cyclase family protein [Rhizobiaceae bacterium]